MSIDALILLSAPASRHLMAQSPDFTPEQLLVDGALVTTGHRFHDLKRLPRYAHAWIHDVLGADFFEYHSDLRGLFVVPDVCEPEGPDYDTVVREVGRGGFWVPPATTAELRSASQEEKAASRDAIKQILGVTKELREAQASGDADRIASAQAELQRIAPAPRLDADPLQKLRDMFALTFAIKQARACGDLERAEHLEQELFTMS